MKKSKYQIFTPLNIVNDILDSVNYNDVSILGKNIIDHSCGDGNFLDVIVRRIIKLSDKENILENLKHVYGFELDKELYIKCIYRLNNILKEHSIDEIEWNIFNTNALKEVDNYDKYFDFVVGNPPYIRIHNLSEDERTYLKRDYNFCKNGNIDIYFAFFELSIKICKTDGLISMITPNSFISNVSGKILRKYLIDNKLILKITNFGSKKIFDTADTYTSITTLSKNNSNEYFEYFHYEADTIRKFDINFEKVKDKDIWIDNGTGGISLKDICNINVGIATLCDQAFIFDKPEINSDLVLVNTKLRGKVYLEKELLKDIIKISQLKNDKVILFPYEINNGKYVIIKEDVMKTNYPYSYSYLLSVRDMLDKRDSGKQNKDGWYGFGRRQGMKMVKDKIIFSPINNKPTFIYHDKACFFYSGYCITLKNDKYSYSDVLNLLNSDEMKEFVEYSSGNFSSGYKSYKKSIIMNFSI